MYIHTHACFFFGGTTLPQRGAQFHASFLVSFIRQFQAQIHQTLGCAPQIPRPQPCGDVLVLAEEEASTDGSRRSAAEEDNSVQTRIHLEGQEGPENPEGAERGQKLRKEIQKNVPAGR